MRCAQAVLCLLVVAATPAAWAGGGSGLKSSAASVHLIGVVNERLSILPGATVFEDSMQPVGNGQGQHPLATITTSWNLNADGTPFAVQAFFRDSDCAAFGDGVGVPGISAAEIAGSGGLGRLHAFPTMASLTGGQGPGSLVFRRERVPGKAELSSRTDAVELPADSGCAAEHGTGARRGILTLMAVVY